MWKPREWAKKLANLQSLNKNTGEFSVKKRSVNFTLVILVLMGLTNLSPAQEVTKIGTTAAKILSIPVGSRALGMGGAFVSVADDATAMYWNPSGIARLPHSEFVFMHSNWLADIRFDFVGLVFPLGNLGSLGFNVTAMTMPEMDITTEYEPEGTGETFSAGSFVAGLTFARNLTDNFSIGGTVKYVSERIWNSSAGGLAIDVGTLFNTPFRGIRLGASISNFGQKMQIFGDDLLVQKDIDAGQAGNNESVNAYLATDRFDLPLNMRIGIASELINNNFSRLIFAVDAQHPNDNTESVNFGAEFSTLRNIVSFRGGLKSRGMKDREEKFALGIGFNYFLGEGRRIKIDYAFEQFVHLKDIHQFTLGITF